MAEKKDNATEMDKQHPLSPENQERYGLNDTGIKGAIKNYMAYRSDLKKSYNQSGTNMAGYRDNGLEDVDYYMEHLSNREGIASGRTMMKTDDGQELPFTRESVAQKLQEGYYMVNVNFDKQKTAKVYSYLTKDKMQRGNLVYAPFTYSPMFNPALAGQMGIAKATIASISTSIKNMLGQSAMIEQQQRETGGMTSNLKILGGGGYIGSDNTLAKKGDFYMGGEKIYSGNYANRNTIGTGSGGNATQVITK